MRRANVQLQADRRSEILEAAQTLLCAFGLPPDLDAGDLRRGRHEPGQSLSLLPLQGRRSSPASRSATAPRPRSSSPRSSRAPDFFDGSRGARAASSGRAQRRRSRALRRDHGGEPPQSRRRAHLSGHRGRRAGALHRDAAAAPPSAAKSRRDIDFDGTVTVLLALADGLSWRRAVEPSFNAEAVMPIVLDMVDHMLVSPAPRADDSRTGESHEG